MGENTTNIGEIIKKKLSISDLADAFGISRPTLYRYIEYYETERRGSMPEQIATYFDYISAEDVDGNDARMRLITAKKNNSSSVNTCAKKSSFQFNTIFTMTVWKWNGGDIKTLPIIKDGKVMVVYEGGFDPRYTLTLFMKVSGELCPIGEYRHEESRGFFFIDDLILCENLFYEVSFYNGIKLMTSGCHPIGGGLL